MSLEIEFTVPRRYFDVSLNLTIKESITGIYGESGSGKTTLFLVLSGLLKPTTGRMMLGEKVLFDMDKNIFLLPHKRRIGMVFQENRLFPHMNVSENLNYAQRFHENKLSDEKKNELINILGLSKLMSEYPRHLSGGEKQRVAIGRALFSFPKLLLLDEPFNGIDSEKRLEILKFLKKTQSLLKIPMLVISHELEDLQRLTKCIITIKKGFLVK